MKRILLLVAALMLVTLIGFGQKAKPAAAPKSPTMPQLAQPPAPADSEFVYARIRYHLLQGVRQPGEVAWHHDYPYSDETFPTVMGEATGVKTNRESYQIVDIDSPDLFKYPFAYICEVGFIDLNDKDVDNLRKYLDRGGFLLVDDIRTSTSRGMVGRGGRGGFGGGGYGGGEDDIANFAMQMKKVYPDREFVRLDIKDPIFHTFYDIKALDIEAPYHFGGQGPVEFLGLRDPHGNLQMVINNNNDISEYWEWIDEGEKSMHDSATSFKYGIDYAMYALTH